MECHQFWYFVDTGRTPGGPVVYDNPLTSVLADIVQLAIEIGQRQGDPLIGWSQAEDQQQHNQQPGFDPFIQSTYSEPAINNKWQVNDDYSHAEGPNRLLE
jgi:hypothetical protein